MPDREELEQMLDSLGERSLREFPDDDAWESLKADIASQWALDFEEAEDGDSR